MVVFGVDAHKATHTVVATDAVGWCLDELTVPNDRSGYVTAYAWACGLGAERIWGIENSGHFGRAIGQYLLSQGEQVMEVSPHLTGKKRRGSKDASKSDPHDALAAARVVLQESIDTFSSGGRLIFHLFGALAEFERNLIRERTKAGLEAARARGRTGGRRKALNAHQRAHAVKLYKANSHSVQDICHLMGISKPTLYSYIHDADLQ